MRSLHGRVALVTGSSRGIGRAIALRLGAHGAAVVVHASERSAESLAQTCALINGMGGRAELLVADLADAGAREDLIEKASAGFGAVDILVNNAAAIPAYAPPSKIDLAARRAGFEVNLQAPIDLMQQALPSMQAKRWGRIINIGSDTVEQPPLPYVGPPKFIHAMVTYGASKAALHRYTVGLAAELDGTGVHANVLAPVRICASDGAMTMARQIAQTRPDWVEPVEMMAEAAYRLVSGSYNGLVIKSRALLQLEQSPLHALDGVTVLGDAASPMCFESLGEEASQSSLPPA